MHDFLVNGIIVAGIVIVTLIPVLTGLLIYCIVKSDKAKKGSKFVAISADEFDNCVKEWRLWSSGSKVSFDEFMVRVKEYDTTLKAGIIPQYGRWVTE